MKFCKDCGKETLEEELKLNSGRCQACQQLISEDMKEKSIYPKFYPRELKHLDKHENIPKKNDENFMTKQVPTIDEIKHFPKPKSGGLNRISDKGKTVIIVFAVWAILTFLLALVINLAFWGAILSHLGRGYWDTLFSDGLWTFFVGGFGALIIILYFYYEVF